MANILIADSGSTKCEWVLLKNGRKKTIITQGISPYFLNDGEIVTLLMEELMPNLKNVAIDQVFFYGTGLSNPINVKLVTKALKHLFGQCKN